MLQCLVEFDRHSTRSRSNGIIGSNVRDGNFSLDIAGEMTSFELGLTSRELCISISSE